MLIQWSTLLSKGSDHRSPESRGWPSPSQSEVKKTPAVWGHVGPSGCQVHCKLLNGQAAIVTVTSICSSAFWWAVLTVYHGVKSGGKSCWGSIMSQCDTVDMSASYGGVENFKRVSAHTPWRLTKGRQMKCFWWRGFAWSQKHFDFSFRLFFISLSIWLLSVHDDSDPVILFLIKMLVHSREPWSCMMRPLTIVGC